MSEFKSVIDSAPRGWGYKQEAVLKAATVQDFEAVIRTLEVDDLRLFMCKCSMNPRQSRQGNRRYFW